METPRELSGGDKLTATWLRNLVRFVKSLRIVKGPGYNVERGPNGTVIKIHAEKARRQETAAAPRLWEFRCTEDPDTHERTGGWYNCRLQVGYSHLWTDADIDGLDECADGIYYAEYDGGDDTVTIKKASGSDVPANDLANALVRIPIGTISNGALAGDPIDCIPIIPIYE